MSTGRTAAQHRARSSLYSLPAASPGGASSLLRLVGAGLCVTLFFLAIGGSRVPESPEPVVKAARELPKRNFASIRIIGDGGQVLPALLSGDENVGDAQQAAGGLQQIEQLLAAERETVWDNAHARASYQHCCSSVCGMQRSFLQIFGHVTFSRSLL